MKIDVKKYKDLVEYIKNQLTDKNWDEIIIYIGFGIGGGYGDKVRYYFKNEEFKFITDIFETDPILTKIFDDIALSKDRDFNKVTVTIGKEDYFVNYEMDEQKIIKEKQSSAEIFSHYLYEKMRTQIYEYEVANNLRKPIYDEYGIADYEESWDSGLFTFMVDAKDKEIYSEIELFLKEEKRLLPLELLDYYKEAILIHHEQTHDELKEFWKPWNKIIVTAPRNIIPVGKEKDYIEYSLESKQVLTKYKNNGGSSAKIRDNTNNKLWSKIKSLWS